MTATLKLWKITIKAIALMAAVLLAADSNGVRAFVSTIGGRTSTTRDTFMMRETPGPAAPKRVMILPDSRAVLSDSDLWPHHLKTRLLRDGDGKWEVSIEDMPDPFSFNTKRYEVLWLAFMAEELALSPETLVVAHGTAADALLRFAENREVWGAVLVCPGGELYHAGERHGRPYVWSRVQRGCSRLAIAHGADDPMVSEDEALRVKTNLGVPDTLFRQIPGGQQRFRDRTGPLTEVEELVAAALTPH